ncbi:MAG TPA: hypothetical protein VGA78_11905 [Gemmatimonadales bacterium]
MLRCVVIALLLPGALAAQEKVNRGWSIDADASIRIHLAAGRLRITGWAHDSVAVTGGIPAGGGSFYGGGRAKGSKLGVETKDWSGSGPASTLEVSLPRAARLWVKTASASVEITGVEGEIDLTSVNGTLTVNGAPRVLTAETIDGSVIAEGGKGVQRLRTGGGSIVVRAGGGDITAATVGGSIDVAAERLERGRLETVTGPLSFSGNVALGGALEAETHSADITLRFVGPVDAELLLATIGGVIYNKLVPKGSAIKGGKPLSFMMGTGGAQVSARSFKGAITVSR